MARIKMERDWNHTWPSRAVTSYKNNGEYTVKREVAEAAVKAGAARCVKAGAARRVKTDPETGETIGVQGGHIDGGEPVETLEGNLSAELAEPQALTPNLHVDGGTETD